MKLYDFATYARRRAEAQAAQSVVEAVEQLDAPGSVIVLKERVSTWFVLHWEVIQRTG